MNILKTLHLRGFFMRMMIGGIKMVNLQSLRELA
jgi:hypothetical protein